ncbi:PDR/VanB family oxidoreductase [Actinomycetospora sp. TBRC 11914]|uniref:PDR/VanB family oxidoreductase n=1 Tax=Actinomycetospora sp. TBRC 11914 TaxID=2729387 RepID=UPI00145C9269|nr:PDR/VanB family oxidoreductase [Actinomycetospora sp. TBRC 11914]NMO91721.1 oxidoreductase [Actinomycetospora sp. TBRC 11914]
MNDRYLDAVVLGRRSLTERIAELTLGAADGRPLPMAEAGSHLELRFGGSRGRFLRHYSVVGPLSLDEAHEPFWRIAVQREDRSRGSSYIHQHFRPGTRVTVSRPIGSFRLARNLPHVLLVAGGIGITPILAMMRSLLVRRQSFTVFYGGLDRAAMAYVDEVEAMGGDAVTIHEGRRDGHPDLDALLAWQPPGTTVYVCGPGPMIDGLRDAAVARGWDPDRVRYEVFNAAHRPEDTDFAVRLATGRVVEVGAGTTILDALERAGVDTLSDCRRGECGLCLTDVLDPHEGIDHRDSYLTIDERCASTQLTICCSRAKGGLVDLDLS